MVSPMTPVTDPQILQQLNGDSEAGLKPVSDPEILKQLNGDNAVGNAKPKDGMLDSIVDSAPFNFVLGAGDALKNTVGGAASLLPGVKYNPVKSGSGASYETGNIAGNIGAFLGGGEALEGLRLAGEGLPLAGELAKQLGGKGISGVARRAIGTGIGGVVDNQDDREGGFEKGAAMSLAADALPGGVKLLGKGAEFLNPQKFTNKLAESIKNSYESSLKKAADEYNPVLEKLGNNKISSSEYANLDKDIPKDYFGPILKNMQSKFLENPTLQNAHDFQSQLGTKIGQLTSKKPDAFTSNTIEGLRQARDSVRNDMLSYLKAEDPKMADKYLRGTEVFREEAAPYRNNPTIYKIAKGDVKTIAPQKLQKTLETVSESNQLGKEHYLSQALEQLSKRTNRSAAARDILSVGAGGLAGEMLAPGIGGGATGAILGKLVGPSAMKLATNPEVTKTISKLNHPYSALMKSIIANRLPGM
jgi:hypothetical protein